MEHNLQELRIRLDKIETQMQRMNLYMHKNNRLLERKINIIIRYVSNGRAKELESLEKKELALLQKELLEFEKLEKGIEKKEAHILAEEMRIKEMVEKIEKETEWQSKVMVVCDSKSFHDEEGVMQCLLSEKRCCYRNCPKH